MPENIRALIVILILSTGLFVFAHRSAIGIVGSENFTRRRNLWYVITLTAFLAQSFWLYALIAILLLLYTKKRETNIPALYFFLLFALPTLTFTVPGMGLINYFIDISHPRILALFLLLPIFYRLIRQSNTLSFGRTGTEKALAAYLLLTAILYVRDSTVTDTLRHAFYLFTDAFLPYYVISRSLKDMQSFRDAVFSLVLAITLVALIAMFETTRHWLLYSNFVDRLDLQQGMYNYLERDGIIRARVTPGQPIALGYLIAIGMGLYLYVKSHIQKKLIRRLGMVVLSGGLIASLSRGPWVGMIALLLAFLATGRNAIPRMTGMALSVVLAFSLIAVLPGGTKVINLLPFIGTTEKENVVGREKLFTNGMIVIQRHPWFGSTHYLEAPEMQVLRTGENIIDIVNTYINIALEEGFVGVGLFVAFFFLALQGIYRAMRSLQDRDSEEYLLGRALHATLIAILIIIFTVSSITIIPFMYWSVAGLGVAYSEMVRKNTAKKMIN